MDVDEPPTSPESFSEEDYEKAPNVDEASINEAPIANEVVEDLTAEECIPSPGSIEALQDGITVIKARPYQKEMLEESLKKNIIVAIIWFLAPTVSLGEQQFHSIKSQIGSVESIFLSSADNVDRWTVKSLWDAVLENVKIVVSTYQVLLDALTHGFVEMEVLGMIVFDEVHNCVKKHPGSKIMRSFYHPRNAAGLDVPHILGLTASPVMRSDPDSVNEIEQTMHAICRTPKQHRADLLLQVKLPVLSEVTFRTLTFAEEFASNIPLIKRLGRVYANLRIGDDPYVQRLRRDNSERSQRALDKVYQNHKTWCSGELKTFHTTALKMWRELGVWAAEFYIMEVLAKYDKIAYGSDESFETSWDIAPAEKAYLAKALNQVDKTHTSNPLLRTEFDISDKVAQLIKVMLEQDTSKFRGIIFVQERAVVSVLAQLLSIHPQTRNIFKIGIMVGTSTNDYRGREMADFVNLDSQNDALIDFRSGKLNLLVATSVLEEGIDVPACNTVFCFQKPANLKSFIQRRGRARQRDSKLIIFHEFDDTKKTEWRQLEENMRRMYEDDLRVLQQLSITEEEEYHDGRFFQVESTGALLNLDNAVSHLYHFCATLPSKAYVDLRPDFICTEGDAKRIRARVILPLSVNESVRFASSKDSWTSEKNAIKDAAFEAYLALYRAGLVNENLLPLLRHGVDVTELTSTKIETRASLMEVNEQINPWYRSFQSGDNAQKHKIGITLSGADLDDVSIIGTLPVSIPALQPFTLYVDSKTQVTVSTTASTYIPKNEPLQSMSLQETWSLLNSAFGQRYTIRQEEFAMMFSIPESSLSSSAEKIRAQDYNFPSHAFACPLIYDISEPLIRYVYRDLLRSKPSFDDIQHPHPDYESAPDGPYLSLRRLPKRADFLNKVNWDGKPPSKKKYTYVLPIWSCVADGIPFRYVQFALFIPSIIYQVSTTLLAQDLSSTILAPLQLKDLSQLITAITSSQASSTNNYQRLEFYGDSILKLCTSIQLLAEYPLWHEGYLSSKKDRLVANSRLSRACTELGLDKYIITKRFTGAKWRPLYASTFLIPEPQKKRTLSSKVLADVIESLIGLSATQSGIPHALQTLQLFLPELPWLPFATRQTTLYNLVPSLPLPPTLLLLQTILCHTFAKPALLLEALTHASFAPLPGTPSQSLERLEFLGDSILDHLVVEEMYSHKPELNHFQMHILRTACVNADFLAFACLEFATTTTTTAIDPRTNQPVMKTTRTPLCKYIRHASPSLAANMSATMARHAVLREGIKRALEEGTHFPWAKLARLEVGKWCSDVVESVLGALWVDCGDMGVCKRFLEDMGVLGFVRRCLRGVKEKETGEMDGDEREGQGRKDFDLGLGLGVHCWHPKEELGVLVGNGKVRYTVFDTSQTPTTTSPPNTSTSTNPTTTNPTSTQPPPPPTTLPNHHHEEIQDTIKGPYACTISINDTPLITCSNGVSKMEIMTRTAEMGVRLLLAKTKEESERDRSSEAGNDVVMSG
ncbi:P-loop containing nucleoside triphosphate hydrolase [Glarea lozoyensis ATCC 20868]|uniref:p-loop containing nucleoside triphosphate hydrolase n=1 Tax=Glarea lozoyensis (strain ATCC 20868 / MF5171) TaxID=1116229 RepID=S3CNM6_GLAL2|nr:P-loop containing nucleoside triphosphate hydrolase [Glarea lozoyensis ATCC 20868]EPE27300.1 P-loop containing nucleoside triphosphate hydrolase [Glarea lozoyensis ATCC 20868]